MRFLGKFFEIGVDFSAQVLSEPRMRFLWVLFAIGIVSSALILSESGQHALLLMMLSMVGIPLAFLLYFVPLVTVLLGPVLITFTVMRYLPGLRKLHGVALFGLSVAAVAGVLFTIPTLDNQKVEAAMQSAVADDIPFSGTRAPGLVIGLDGGQLTDTWGDARAALLLASPDIRVVFDDFDQLSDNSPAMPSADSTTWGLVQKGVGLCPPPPNQASTALRIAMAKAELKGICVGQIPNADHIDVIVRTIKIPGDARGQVTDDSRTELFLRQGDRLRLAYRVTKGFREELPVPLIFFSADGYGFDLGMSLAPTMQKVPLKSPVAILSEHTLIEAALPGDIILPSFEAAGKLSREQRAALQKQEDDIRQALVHARYQAALAALRSDDSTEIAKGFQITKNYLRGTYSKGLAVSDIPLLSAFVSAPSIPFDLDHRILSNSPPEVTMAVVDAVIDRLATIGEGQIDRSTRSALGDILHWAEQSPQFDVGTRLERLDQLASTPIGRELGRGLIAMRGLLGPDQAQALFNYLDARISDGESGEALRTTFRGLCLMGPEGVQFLDDFADREAQLRMKKPSVNMYDTSFNLTLMGLDDATIRKYLHFELYTDGKQLEGAEREMNNARVWAENRLARALKNGILPPWWELCR